MFSLQIANIHKEHANKQLSLISKHTEELRRTELHAEAELREVPHLSKYVTSSNILLCC